MALLALLKTNHIVIEEWSLTIIDSTHIFIHADLCYFYSIEEDCCLWAFSKRHNFGLHCVYNKLPFTTVQARGRSLMSDGAPAAGGEVGVGRGVSTRGL